MYRQLAAILREQIESGQIAGDRPIPSKTTLKQQYGISDSTYKAAIDVLRDEGLVRGVKGKGVYAVRRG